MWDESPRFIDRESAGLQLAHALARFAVEKPIVLGLPRGGVPVAVRVAASLKAPLDVLVVRKVAAPFQPELGIGAVAEGDVQVIDTVLAHQLGISGAEIARLVRERSDELDERIATFRQGHPRMDLQGRLAIIVDDGLATGSTAHAAIRSARRAGADRVVLAVPVGSQEAVRRLGDVADEVICLEVPRDFIAVGAHYERFPQLDDADVAAALPRALDTDVAIPCGPHRLPGILTVPAAASTIVVFAHGSGSSRLSPRNAEVARVLNESGVATLLMDLLTEEEESDRRNVFDIEELAGRLERAMDWCRESPRTERLGICLFGASTGAAAALVAAARRPDVVRSVVSRGGRPDLAGPWLAQVQAPTLLIVGGDDVEVLRLNRDALSRLRCPASLAVIPGATHLFEEPGTLARAASTARDWFTGKTIPRAA